MVSKLCIFSPVAIELEKEAGLKTDDVNKRERTTELSSLISDVRNNDCELVLNWIDQNEVNLAERGKTLKWKIKRLKFCQALTQNPPLETSDLCEHNLIIDKFKLLLVKLRCDLSNCCQAFYETELKQLMTSLLFRKNIRQSRYKDLIDRCLNSIPEICEDLRNDFGHLYNMPELSHEHLMSAHAAGCVG